MLKIETIISFDFLIYILWIWSDSIFYEYAICMFIIFAIFYVNVVYGHARTICNMYIFMMRVSSCPYHLM